MSEILQFIGIAVLAVAVVAIVLKIFKIGIKTILKIVINAAIGIGAIFLINLIPGVMIPINWWTALITGIFGIPGVILVLILSFFI